MGGPTAAVRQQLCNSSDMVWLEEQGLRADHSRSLPCGPAVNHPAMSDSRLANNVSGGPCRDLLVLVSICF